MGLCMERRAGGGLNKQDLRRRWNYCLKQLESARKIWKTTTDTSPKKTTHLLLAM